MSHFDSQDKATPLAEAAPALVDALPRYAPTDVLTIHADRLLAITERLGYDGLTLVGYDGPVRRQRVPGFMDAYAPRIPADTPSGKPNAASGTLELPLNVAQMDEWASRHPDGTRHPVAWGQALSFAIRAAFVDEGQRVIREVPGGKFSYVQNALMQFHSMLPIIGHKK
jgi:hypothetical protein